MSLKDIFCQERAIDVLQRGFAADKLAHAYIFSGPDGIGKYTTAKEWAKMVLCHNRVKENAFSDSCGGCPSCLAFEAGSHPDFKPVYKELVKFTQAGKHKTTPVDMPIDVIREFLIAKVYARPTMSDGTVFVVREAEKLNAASQNALLKVLEEPPGYCCIILLCSRLEKLLPTTLSRCRLVRFGPVDEEHIVNKLAEISTLGEEATYWARFSEGSIGTAMAWAALKLKKNSCYEIKKQLIKNLAGHELADSVEFAAWMGQSAKEISSAWSEKEPDTSKTDITRRAQKGLLRMVIAAFNDVIKVNVACEQGLINSDQMAEIQTLADKCDVEKAAENVHKAYENMRWIDASVNEKLIFEELLLNYAGCDTIGNSVV